MSYTRSEIENRLVSEFLSNYFPIFSSDVSISQEEEQIIQDILSYVDKSFNKAKYVLGLALDFALLAQRLSIWDVAAKEKFLLLSEEDLFQRYTLVTEKGTTKANTLTLKYQGNEEGIRTIEEKVASLFHRLRRRYPSAYVYNTGQWQKYKDLLVLSFKLSEGGRFELCQRAIDYGLQHMGENRYFGRPTARIRLFPIIIEDYQPIGPGENAGLVLQSLAFGFFYADRPHLHIIADKVRTGSSRQRRFGDIDAYHSLDLELSVEVKDMSITMANFDHQVGTFIGNIEGSGVVGIVFARDFDNDAMDALQGRGVVALTVNDALAIVKTWDWQKQDDAVSGMLHYLAHIEQNPNAVKRLLLFIKDHDPDYDALAFIDTVATGKTA